MGRRALVIGGTGPTGVWIVLGLLDRGWDVTILHRGTHERAETPAEVEHLHHDPYDAEDLARALADRQDDLVVADDGLTLHHHGYTRNLAHAVLLAVDQPEGAAGTVFNAGDEEVLSVRQVVELVAAALDAELELVSMPYDLAVPARPLLTQPLPTHRVLDLTRLRTRLGYRDVTPAREAVALTARWLAEHPPEPGGPEETVLTDPFDYGAEDRLMDAWGTALAGLAPIEWARPPRYGLAYSGPGGRPRSQARFEP